MVQGMAGKRKLTSFELTSAARKWLAALRKKWNARSNVQTIEEALRKCAEKEGIK
jgi:hypothetical protein